MNIAREEMSSKDCTWGTPKRLGIEKINSNIVEKWPVKLQEDHDHRHMLLGNQEKKCLRENKVINCNKYH